MLRKMCYTDSVSAREHEGEKDFMDEKRYLISDAAKVVQAEPHVLRYWEEELELPIQRTELGHRYYTEEDIQTFENIKELKERGFQLKAIKVLLPELKKRKADSSAEIIDLEQKLAEQEKEKAEPEGNITVFPLTGSGQVSAV